jgi:excisionase family DNA binding protein
VPKEPARRKRKPKLPSVSVLVREPDYDDTYILTPALVAELFGVSPRSVRRWADSGVLPSFRTVGGQRRFRWGEVRHAILPGGVRPRGGSVSTADQIASASSAKRRSADEYRRP